MFKRNFLFVPLALFLTGLFLIGFLYGQTEEISTNKKFNQVRFFINSVIARMNLASISVAVARDGEIIWEESFGWADREKKIKATPHSIYGLASITKPMTATGLMLLEEKGLVDLNTSANTYLGEAELRAYEGSAQEATVKRLLLHTAGLPMYWNYFFEDGSYLRPDMDVTIGRSGILTSPPGESYDYSNLGYGIIEYIIEQVSKKSYPEFMKTEVFEPLGLNETYIFTSPPQADLIVQRYVENRNAAPFIDLDTRGCGAVYSSVHDLIRFGIFHLKNSLPDQKQILSPESIDKMQNERDPLLPDINYSLGWDVRLRYGYGIVNHGGSMPGTRSQLVLIPSENIAVAVLCNGENFDLFQVCDYILSVLLPTYKKECVEQRRKGSNRSRSSPIPQEVLGEWQGKIITYKEEIPVRINFESDGNAKLWMLNETDLDSDLNICQQVDKFQFEQGILTGSFDLDIPLDFSVRCRHKVRLFVKLRGRRLSGYALAQSYRGAGEVFALPSYIELKK